MINSIFNKLFNQNQTLNILKNKEKILLEIKIFLPITHIMYFFSLLKIKYIILIAFSLLDFVHMMIIIMTATGAGPNQFFLQHPKLFIPIPL